MFAIRALLCGAGLSFTALAQNVPLLDILQRELQRNYLTLREKADPAPYYAAYAVTDQEAEFVSATRGVLLNRNHLRSRNLDVTIRVGTPKLDNYHPLRGERAQFTSGASIPIEDVPLAIARQVWSETDRVYRLAAQRLINIKTNTQVKLAEDDDSDDFSPQDPAQSVVAIAPFQFDRERWAKRARDWSAVLNGYPQVISSNVTVQYQREMKSLVNSEGTRLQHGRGFARILITAQGKAADGMDLSAYQTLEAESPDRLPDEKAVRAVAEKVGRDLTALLNAPLVDPYVGPAILSGSAAGVFFHEIFGHRVEGHRLKEAADGQTFAKSLNTAVLPDFLSVVFDPTRRTLGSTDLNGYYLYDDEGVKAKPVQVVDRGVLKTFLMSRTPIKGIGQSNGHGRRQAGAEVVSRQSNLIVESARQVSTADLRRQLLEEVKRQGKEYGFYFQQVTGGFTFTDRRSLAAFKVLPVMVYRVYADGRKDELVRGVDIVGTPLASFRKITATGDRSEVFNGYCGAESGSVPVSAVAPALLVSEIEIQKRESGKDKPPLLPQPPPSAGGAE